MLLKESRLHTFFPEFLLMTNLNTATGVKRKEWNQQIWKTSLITGDNILWSDKLTEHRFKKLF